MSAQLTMDSVQTSVPTQVDHTAVDVLLDLSLNRMVEPAKVNFLQTYTFPLCFNHC